MSSNVGNSPSRGHYSSKYVCPEHGCIQFYKTDTTNIKLQINPNTAIMMTLILHCSPPFPTFPLLPPPPLPIPVPLPVCLCLYLSSAGSGYAVKAELKLDTLWPSWLNFSVWSLFTEWHPSKMPSTRSSFMKERLFLRLWSNATFSTKLPQFKQLELIQPLPFPSLQLITGSISLSLSTSSSQSHRKPELEPERHQQRERQSGRFSLNSSWPPPQTS